jgi:hypothetical protein
MNTGKTHHTSSSAKRTMSKSLFWCNWMGWAGTNVRGIAVHYSNYLTNAIIEA